ncbi:MAG: hypothetical protein JWM73_1428, partial [Solirubrobacterales bacterium]|nr:hypothetical protein [Solirubrobacterales bacterium]
MTPGVSRANVSGSMLRTRYTSGQRKTFALLVVASMLAA